MQASNYLMITPQINIIFMNYNNFIQSTKNINPPSSLTQIELAIWHVVNNNWENAHNLAQKIDNEIGSWIHAHIHRIEGDTSNANYWYSKANREYPKSTLQEEVNQIIQYITNK